MDTQSAYAFKDVVINLCADVTDALSDRVNETPDRRAARVQTTANLFMSFRPRDTVEAMLVGHCMMFHEMIVDSVGDSFRGEENKAKRAARGNIVAMDRSFGANLDRLQRSRSRPPGQPGDAPNPHPPTDRAETDIAERMRRHTGDAPARPAGNQASQPAGNQASQPAGKPAAPAAPAPASAAATPQATPQATASSPWAFTRPPAEIAPASPEAASPAMPAGFVPVANGAALSKPSPEEIAACFANGDPVRALKQGDVSTMSAKVPSREQLKAASSLSSPFDGPPIPAEPASADANGTAQKPTNQASAIRTDQRRS